MRIHRRVAVRRLSGWVKIDWQSMSVLVIDSEPELNRGGLPVAVSRAVDSTIRSGEQPAFLPLDRRVIP